MDRKSGENKTRQSYYLTMTGSDGERERRYKTTGRRARSRDSEIMYNRHKPDPGLTLRHRSRDRHPKSPFEDDFSEQSLDTPSPKTKYDFNMKGSKKLASPKSDIDSPLSNISTRVRHSQESEESPIAPKVDKFKFDNDFVEKSDKKTFENDFFGKDFRKSNFDFENEPEKDFRESPRGKINFRQESQFEDDFSPTDKTPPIDGIGCIVEEHSTPTETFSPNNLDKTAVAFNNESIKRQRSALGKRLSGNLRADLNLKKSESVNIFARENDPFDDDFFSKPENGGMVSRREQKNNESVQWSENFDCFEVIDEDQ